MFADISERELKSVLIGSLAKWIIDRLGWIEDAKKPTDKELAEELRTRSDVDAEVAGYEAEIRPLERYQEAIRRDRFTTSIRVDMGRHPYLRIEVSEA